MSWRTEIARSLRALLLAGEATRIAVLAPGTRDLTVLLEALPGAMPLGLSQRAGRRTGEVIVASGPVAGAEVAAIATETRPGRCVSANGGLDAVVVWLLSTRFAAVTRRQILAQSRRALRVGGTLLVVDHNRPRGWWPWVRSVGWCLLRGVEPHARPAYPVAREVRAAAFEAISLRFALGERVQIVRAKRPPNGPDSDACGATGVADDDLQAR